MDAKRKGKEITSLLSLSNVRGTCNHTKMQSLSSSKSHLPILHFVHLTREKDFKQHLWSFFRFLPSSNQKDENWITSFPLSLSWFVDRWTCGREFIVFSYFLSFFFVLLSRMSCFLFPSTLNKKRKRKTSETMWDPRETRSRERVLGVSIFGVKIPPWRTTTDSNSETRLERWNFSLSTEVNWIRRFSFNCLFSMFYWW